jgi:hypothetical protein
MNKRGIELAANFIIVLIISIIVFGLASALTYKIFCASGDKIAELDSATEKRVEQLLDSGAAVNIPDASKKAKSVAGFCGEEAGSSANFVLGIRNDFNSATTFTFDCSYSGMVQPDDTIALPSNAFSSGPGSCDVLWNWQHSDTDVVVPAREKKSSTILFNVPSQAPEGKHVFTISVTYNAGGTTKLYGAKKVYLTVQ